MSLAGATMEGMGDSADPLTGVIVLVLLFLVTCRLLRFAFVWFVFGVLAIVGGSWVVGILFLVVGEFVRASARAG